MKKHIKLEIHVKGDQCMKTCPMFRIHESAQYIWPGCLIFGILDGTMKRPIRAIPCSESEIK